MEQTEPTQRTARRPQRMWMLLLAVGVAAILAGGALILGPLYGVWHRGQADSSALKGWQAGPNALAGPPSANASVTPDPARTTCGSSSPNDYALLTFDQPASYHYAGVSGDGTWDLL